MVDVNRIAQGMLKLINSKQTITQTFLKSLVGGLTTFSQDIFLVAKDFFDTDNRWRNETDKIRLAALIKRGSSSEDLKKMASIVVRNYWSNLTSEQIELLAVKVGGTVIGKMVFNLATLSHVLTLFFERAITRFVFSIGIGAIFSIGAAASDSVYSSNDLKSRNLKIYNELRAHGDLDLLYFLLKDFLDPYLDAIDLQSVSPKLSNDVFTIYVNGIIHV
ncbi:hypothetical protein [Pectobacterium parmentieri]|uniref:hypothetical protein n=1 Tax=Pectobacterium parmentieri TaxID=1905730 RepID=UPI0018DFED45|nr:hypothetical protein [Pectobacterium parmentieri]MBI0551459.1 hypothetical protein [Pectobacterium parmentieri]MBI0557628.1 hypothetical protein [Pectobacterium parmentieri]MBI0564099.1 hypothetical protein [Pectobacterium parmentieri]